MQQGQDLEQGISQVHNPSSVRPSKVHVHTAPRRLPQAPHCSPRDAQYTGKVHSCSRQDGGFTHSSRLTLYHNPKLLLRKGSIHSPNQLCVPRFKAGIRWPAHSLSAIIYRASVMDQAHNTGPPMVMCILIFILRMGKLRLGKDVAFPNHAVSKR